MRLNFGKMEWTDKELANLKQIYYCTECSDVDCSEFSCNLCPYGLIRDLLWHKFGINKQFFDDLEPSRE